ncbi:MAG TPA: TIM barrel protein [Tepidisphaeraceae bacterium]|jgi:sugar phosphate isomerase/epimerase|nr:TIM barrel protein [Tepidisphaeraceae bacterium]
MKLACADFTFPLLPHDSVLKLIFMLNLDGVDIGLFEERSHLWPSREFAAGPERSGRALASKLSDLNLQCADVFLQLDPDFTPYAINHPDASRRAHARDAFLKTLDYASAASCHHVTTLPGILNPNEDAATSFSRAADELAWRVAQSASHQITLGVEAHVGSLAPDPASALQLVTSVPGLTLTLDYTHFTRSGLPDSAAHPLLPYASHFHARGAKKGRLQCPVKDNIINYNDILSRLRAQNYPGWIGIEYVWIDWEECNTCDNLSETILLRDLLRDIRPA